VKRPSVFYWLIAIAIAAVVIAASFYCDDAVRLFMKEHQGRAERDFMRDVSRFGDWPSHLAIGLILLIGAWSRHSKKWMVIFLSMLLAMTISSLVARALKITTARPRPSVKTEEAGSSSRWSSKNHAFPSGHVAASMGFFGVLLFASRKIGVACLAIPLLIGVSRLYLAAHYFSDVVCAAILGLLCAFLVSRALLKQDAPLAAKI
jgi:membrane-associated phospholipid phosphatase